LILDDLDWELNLITPILMISHLLVFFEIPDNMLNYVYRHAQTLADKLISYYEFAQYLPSELAMACIYYSLKICKLPNEIFENAMHKLGDLLDSVRKHQILVCCGKMASYLIPEPHTQLYIPGISSNPWKMDVSKAITS
jgi:hypothetical protein